MSGRHRKKRKGHQKTDARPSPAAVDVKLRENETENQPEKRPCDVWQYVGEFMKLKWFNKPDPFDVAIWGLILALMVGGIYYLQLRSMQESVKISRQAMQVDQRAWVEATFTQDSDKIPLDGLNEVSFPMKIVNVGKTPATNLRVEDVVEILDHDKSPSLDYSGSHRVLVTFGVLFPSGHYDFPASRLKPNDVTTNPTILSQAERDSLSIGGSYVAAFGTVTYADSFGISHWTHWCWWRGFAGKDYKGTFEADKCTAYNDVDRNPLE